MTRVVELEWLLHAKQSYVVAWNAVAVAVVLLVLDDLYDFVNTAALLLLGGTSADGQIAGIVIDAMTSGHDVVGRDDRTAAVMATGQFYRNLIGVGLDHGVLTADDAPDGEDRIDVLSGWGS